MSVLQKCLKKIQSACSYIAIECTTFLNTGVNISDKNSIRNHIERINKEKAKNRIEGVRMISRRGFLLEENRCSKWQKTFKSALCYPSQWRGGGSSCNLYVCVYNLHNSKKHKI